MRLLTTALLILVSFSTHAQKDKKNQMAVYDYAQGTPKKWNYIVVKDSTKAKIVDYLPAPAMCGYFAFASVTIVETENHQTIRILGLCNMSNEFKPNQEVTIVPQSAPEFDVQFPFDFAENKETGKMEAVSGYDLKILNTCWGTLIKT